MKKSLGLLVCLFAIPALLGCSEKNSSESKQSEQPASSEPAPAPSSSEKEYDPEEVLPDFKDATEVTVNNDLSGNFPIVVGTPLRFKFHFGAGIGKDRFLGLAFYGNNISKASKVESQWLDYKGQPVAKNDYGYAWGQYDGWMYLEINKTDDFAMFMVLHDQSDEEIEKYIKKTVDENTFKKVFIENKLAK